MKKFGGPNKLKQGSLNDLIKLVDKGVEGVSKLYDKYNKMHGTNINVEEKIKQNALEQKEVLASLVPKRKSTFNKKIYKIFFILKDFLNFSLIFLFVILILFLIQLLKMFYFLKCISYNRHYSPYALNYDV